jgi:hypothetical protein
VETNLRGVSTNKKYYLSELSEKVKKKHFQKFERSSYRKLKRHEQAEKYKENYDVSSECPSSGVTQ